MVVVGLLCWGWVLVDRNARSWGYAEREEDLYVKRGALFRRLVVVPYGRMQLIDINRGPVVRALGLSDLKFVTAAAASAVTIPGVPADEAERLRDRLDQRPHPREAGEARAARDLVARNGGHSSVRMRTVSPIRRKRRKGPQAASIGG